jgi:hypothetical protein
VLAERDHRRAQGSQAITQVGSQAYHVAARHFRHPGSVLPARAAGEKAWIEFAGRVAMG